MTPMKGCFVTGTDTEVGKTWVSAGLLHLLAAHGLRTVGVKPVAAGMTEHDGRWVNEDVRVLQEAASVASTEHDVACVQFHIACAPHLAARLEGKRLDRSALVAHVQRQALRGDFTVVEGVGGFRVPLSDRGDPTSGPRWGMDDVAVDLGLPVVLVVGLRLGCLNHALLTAQAVRATGLRLVGWVCNRVDPNMTQAAENLDTLRQWLPAPCLGDVPWLDQPSPGAVAKALDASAVRAALSVV